MRTSRTVSMVTSEKDAIWRSALVQEGFGVVVKRERGQTTDVSAEIEDMVDSEKIQAFYGKTVNDKLLRSSMVRDYAAPFFPDIKKLNDTIVPTYSFFHSVVDHVAALYRSAPVRWVGGGETETRYTELSQNDMTIAMKQANGAWYAHGCVAVMPYVMNGRLRYSVKSPNDFRVLLDDEGRVEKFMYEKWVRDQYLVVVWTPTSHYYRNSNGDIIPIIGNEGMENPYGVIPAVFVNGAEFFPGGASDLLESCLEFNFARMQGIEDLTFSNLNVALMTNCGIREGDKIGPRDIYARDGVSNDPASDAPPSVTFANAESHTQTYLDYQDRIRKDAHLAEGVPAHYLTEQSQELSGTALRQTSKPLLDKIHDQREVFANAERDLYEVLRAICGVSAPAGLSIAFDGEFHIDFADEQLASNPKEEWDLLKEQMESGVVSVVDVLSRYNADVTDEVIALQFIQNNKRLLRMMRGGGFVDLVTQ